MSLLIKGVQIVDGLGAKPYKADVLVQQNIISAIGELKGRKSDVVVDGLGNYLTPGFIDIHSTSDHYLSLFDNPSQDDFIRQGITTSIGGHCGVSLAPLLYGSLESVGKWADASSVNVDWHSVAEFYKTLSRIGLGVNYGTFVGYNTIRHALSHGRVKLESRELDVLKKILCDSMDAGAYGLSTGFNDLYGKRIPKKEIKELVQLVGDNNGIYTTCLRNETDSVADSVHEIVKIAELTGTTTIISDFRPIKKFERQFREALKIIDETNAPIYFDVSPYPVSIRPIYSLLPEWAQKKDIDTILATINDRKNATRIKNEWGRFNGKSIRISGAPNREYLVNKTIKEIADNSGVDIREALLNLMKETKLRLTVAVSDVNEKILVKLLDHKRAFISSHGNSVLSGEFMKHEYSFNSFPKYLRDFVRQ